MCTYFHWPVNVNKSRITVTGCSHRAVSHVYSGCILHDANLTLQFPAGSHSADLNVPIYPGRLTGYWKGCGKGVLLSLRCVSHLVALNLLYIVLL